MAKMSETQMIELIKTTLTKFNKDGNVSVTCTSGDILLFEKEPDGISLISLDDGVQQPKVYCTDTEVADHVAHFLVDREYENVEVL